MNYLTLLLGAYLASLNTPQTEVKHNLREWHSFKAEHSKTYESVEVENLRRSIFAHNKHRVDTFNAQKSNEAGFSLALNRMADLSEPEIKVVQGYKLSNADTNALRNSPKAEKFLSDILNNNSSKVPDEVDWRKEPGRVTRVKDQGLNCGSCWSFATTGVLEGQEKVRSGNSSFGDADLVELSEQNLLDCDTTDYACNGGIMNNALEFVRKEGGIDDEKSYPYEAARKNCRFSKSKVAFGDLGAAILPEGDEEALKKVVAKFGPVAVAIDAQNIDFSFYKEGVYYDKYCGSKPDNLTHAVLVVGYGSDADLGDYWIVKNSWGLSWGDQGYIKMARNRKNNCGIATMATIPVF